MRLSFLLCAFSLAFAWHPSSHAASTLKVLTYNVWGLPRPLSKDPVGRLEAFCAFLKKQSLQSAHPWDVVLLQEVWKPWMARGLRYCGYPFSARLDKKSFGTGLMILSLHPVTSANQFNFENEPSWWDSLTTGEAFSDKGVLSATIEHPDFGPIFFANTHLVANYGLYKTFEDERRGQFRELAAHLYDRARGIPQILGGDLNVAPYGLKYTLLWEELHFLFPGFRRFMSMLPVSTRSLSNPFSNEEEGHIDHLFGLNGAKPIKGSVVLDGRREIFSDHYGWETSFEVEPLNLD
ncbi:MAG: endonuclease/exonuclease/phosphatase family protein [Oligoflexia bacterium]